MVQDGYWKFIHHMHIPDRKKEEGQNDFTSQMIKLTSKESVLNSLITFLRLSNCPEFSQQAIWFLREAGLLAQYIDTPNDIGGLLLRKKKRTYLG